MAGDEIRRTSRKDAGPKTSKSKKSPENENTAATAKPEPARPLDAQSLREARLAYLSKSPEERRRDMKYEYVKTTKSVVQPRREGNKRRGAEPGARSREQLQAKPSVRSAASEARSRKRAQDSDSEDDYVYGKPPEDPVPTGPSMRSAKKERVKGAASHARKATRTEKLPERRNTEPARRRPSHHDGERESAVDGRDVPIPRGSTSVDKASRPVANRGATAGRTKSEAGLAKPAETSKTARSDQVPLFGGLFQAKPPPPPKLVSCLTCGDDEIPIHKSAKLPCTHRMCHSCLKRVFSMSVTDPAHMPPRCCTDQHIDLKHVDKLFDQKFKETWNRKFQEYKTKNRIYCPARGCGAWIKPHYISVENGRKVGRCKQCKTKVCAICSQKMHTKRECPKDPETKKLIEVAKEKGWQRCYSCNVMVELKEGCNHMTCRCTAEFCMVCGLKWKSCDCPWFNFEQVDGHLGDPVRYQAEMDRRREQINRDEELARRMNAMDVTGGRPDQDVFGIGAPNHLNQNFYRQAREALTANYAQAEQAARGLLNGYFTGRENPLPGMPLPLDEFNENLRAHHGSGGGPAPTRRPTIRRRSMRDQQGRNIQEWANRVAS